MLGAVKDRRHQDLLRDRIDALQTSPELQGTPLEGDLRGFRTVRAVGQRYRIVYSVAESVVTVYVVAVGLRKEGSCKDVHRLTDRIVAGARRWIVQALRRP